MRRIARIALAWSLTVAASAAVAQTWYPVSLPPKVKETKVILPASRDYNAPGGLPVRKLFDYGTRDPHVMLAPDGMYYMVATAFANTLPAPLKSRPDANGWWYNDGIPLWRSKDMINWETLGYVWTLDHDATWAKAFKQSPHTERPDKAGLRAVWAPEIHYFKGTYWMPYAMNYDGIGVLKSTSGKPEGPYVDIKTDGPLVDDAIDASLFEDTDGKIYLLWNGYQIARMKDDMSGLAEAPRKLDFDPPPPWGEGINMQKINGKYVFTNAGVMPTVWHGRKENTYDCFSATADSVYGPYTGRFRAIPHDGHQDLFQDKQGNWWSSYFGSGPVAPWGIEPGVLPVTIDANGRLSPKRSYPRPEWRYTTAAPPDAWTEASFDDSTWKTGPAGFGDLKMMESGPVTDVATPWTEGGIWMRRTFTLDGPPVAPSLFLRNSGKVQISINQHVVYESSDHPEDYVTVGIDPACLVNGANVITVHGEAGAEPAYLDVGLVDTQRRVLSPTALEGKTEWKYTTDRPAGAWQSPGFDDAAWKTGVGGFGAEGTPHAIIGTPWKSDDIWIRRTFDVSGTLPKKLMLHLHYDESPEIYVNGVLAFKAANFLGDYTTVPMSPEAAASIHPGKNVIAAHCTQTIGGQYLDVGVIAEP